MQSRVATPRRSGYTSKLKDQSSDRERKGQAIIARRTSGAKSPGQVFWHCNSVSGSCIVQS